MLVLKLEKYLMNYLETLIVMKKNYDYEMDSTEKSNSEADIDMIDDTTWTNNNWQTEKYQMFTGKPGIQKELPTNPTFMDYFALFMPNHNFEIIATETLFPRTGTS